MSIKATERDFYWLVSPEARPWLDRAAAAGPGAATVAQTRRLRAGLGQLRTQLVLEQAELRARAKVKFSRAADMFFTRTLLEQATDEQISRYKARRFQTGREMLDLCCGLGGDLLALASVGPVTGVDKNPQAAILAAANCRVYQAESVFVRTADAASIDVAEFSAWHIDPDRRPRGRRTTRLESHEPSLDQLERLISLNSHAGVKLAPAAALPARWAAEAECEWIGSRRECRQLVAWFGNLARAAGRRTATVVGPKGRTYSISGDGRQPPPVDRRLGRFLYEPHPAVLAARLDGVLAVRYGLTAIAPGVPYFAGDHPIDCPAVAAFEVTDVLPFDRKRVRRLLRDRDLGRLEIKCRGVKVTPEEVLRRVQPRGTKSAVLILAPGKRSTLAILARRVVSGS